VMAAFVAACHRAAALEAQATDRIDVAIWEKFIVLTALSATTSLLRATMGQILANPETSILQRQLVDEGIAVGRAAGKVTRTDFGDEIMKKFAMAPPSFRSSMSEDLERGKPLELRWLSGRIHNLGLQYHVPTPAHSVVYRALLLYEQGKPS
jgi:2-dehydropantoate 2-reductase